MSKVAIIDPDGRALRYGKDLKVDTGQTLGVGKLARINPTTGKVELGSAGAAPSGVVYGNRDVYKPTSTDWTEGENVTLAVGDFLAYLSADYFSGGALPSAGSIVYAAADGLLGTSGTNKVGKCMRQVSAMNREGISQTVAEILFEIGKP